MRITAGILGVLLVASNLVAGPESIIKQRAKELVNQNNVRQGVGAPVAPAQPVPATPATASGPAPGAARLNTDLAAIKANSQPTVPQNQLITQDLMAIAGGGSKLSSATAARLAKELSGALSTKEISAAERARLVQDIVAALSTPAMPMLQMQAIVADVQAILQANGMQRNAAVAVATDVRTVAMEIKPQ